MKRQRGRNRNNNNRNNNHNNHNRAMDSNGPDVKVRGTASTIYEKYTALARDAQSSGNRVKAENLRQHAEHYLRIMNIQEAAKRAAQEEREAARAARGETDENESETDERKPRKHNSRRNHRDKNDTPKMDDAKSDDAKSGDTETETSAEDASDAAQPKADNDIAADAVSEHDDNGAAPKRRRKAPARKAETSETVDVAE